MNNFVIENGALKKYKGGVGRDVVIPDGVTEIGKEAFIYCHFLESITIPNSVKTINKHVFGDCISLKTVSFSDSIEQITNGSKYGAFKNCPSLDAETRKFISEHKGSASAR